MQGGDEVSINTLTQESGAETVVSNLEKETLDETLDETLEEKRARHIREREQARRAREQKELEEYKAMRAREKKEEAKNVASKEKEVEPEPKDAQPEANEHEEANEQKEQNEENDQGEANELGDALAKIADDVEAGKMSRRQARSARVRLLMADMSKGEMSKEEMSKEELFRWKQNIQRTEQVTGKRLVHVRRRFNNLL